MMDTPMHAHANILVTGGAGFIGTPLVERLVAAGHTVRVLERPGADCAHLPQEDIELVSADIRDAQAVCDATRGCTIVMHLAANPNLWARDSDEFEQVNHQGTRNVLQAAAECGVQRTVYVSTESILAPRRGREVITEDTRTTLDDMIGPYCRSKWLAEQAAAEAADNGQPVVIVRPSIPVGAGDRRMGPASRMICDFINGRIKGYLAGDLNFIDVHDVARGIEAAARVGQPGCRYLLVNEHWTIQQLLQELGRLTGRPAPRWRVPFPLALGFAHVEELACRILPRRVPMATITGVRLTQRSFQFDGTRSARELGILPLRSCRESIEESLPWYEQLGRITLPTTTAAG